MLNFVVRGFRNATKSFNYKVLLEGHTYGFYPHIIVSRNSTTYRNGKNKERKFSKKHLWVVAEGEIGTVGLSNYAQQKLGELIFVQLPRVKTTCVMDEPCGVLESLLTVWNLCSPVSGVVTEKNIVEDAPRMINQSCYEKGWLFKLELSKIRELNMLMSEDEYKEFVMTEPVNCSTR